MTFTNTQVDLAGIPDYSAIEMLPVERRHATINATIAAVIAAVIAVVLLVLVFVVESSARPMLAALCVAVSIVGALLTLYTHAYCRSIGYALRTHDIVLHKGVFFFSETVQPLARVQHVELQRGPFEKRYGLACIKLYSAGSGKETFALPGLTLADAQRIRAHVLDYQQ